MGKASTSTKSGFVGKLSALIAGLQAAGVLPQGFTMWVNSVSYTPATAATVLQKTVGAYQAVDAARTATKAAESTRDEGEALAQALYRQIVDALKAQLGETNPLLEKFGVPPRKAPAVKSAQEKAQASAQRQATREARHIMGSKQRSAIVATNIPKVVVVDGTEATATGASTASAPASTSSKS